LPTPGLADDKRRIKVYFSTVIRAAPLERGGEFVLLDWQTKTVEARVPIYPTNPEIQDPNPRGNARGGRGIEFLGDHVVAASYHTLKVYDRKLTHQRDISHPLMVGLHEIHSDGEAKIWVASTGIDGALVIDFETGDAIRQYWPREMPGLQRELNLTPLRIDKQVDNRARFLEQDHAKHSSHLHLNSVVNWQGETYALFNAYGVIANLDRDEVAIRDNTMRHGHSLRFQEDGTAIVNNTFDRSIHIYDLQTKTLKRVIRLADFELVRTLVRKHQFIYVARGVLKRLMLHQISAPRPIFVRGLDRLDDYLFVGISPASILCIDRQSGELVDHYCYSDDVAACVHGLRVRAE
jgi:hypothetical protein